jgi:hypothetical protein
VPVVVPAALHLGLIAHVVLCRFEGGDGARGITRTRFPEGEDVPLSLWRSEFHPIPFGILGENLQKSRGKLCAPHPLRSCCGRILRRAMCGR